MTKIGTSVLLLLSLILSGCSLFKRVPDKQKGSASTGGSSAQTENVNKEAFATAASLTEGWPASSTTAANEMVAKYGDPDEKTTNTLIWRNVAPFKEILVHKEVYSHRFPLLHKNSLQHVVNYKAPVEKIDDVWRYNGSVVLDRTKGQMSSYAENEAMNILALNLAHDVLAGRMNSDAARVTYGKETLNFLNGFKTAQTQVLSFGSQYQTSDAGTSVTNKIRWIGDPAIKRKPAQKLNLRQAQEEK